MPPVPHEADGPVLFFRDRVRFLEEHVKFCRDVVAPRTIALDHADLEGLPHLESRFVEAQKRRALPRGPELWAYRVDRSHIRTKYLQHSQKPEGRDAPRWATDPGHRG